MIINWKFTKHETEAEASAADGFIKLKISRMDGPWRGFAIVINGRKLKDRPNTMDNAMKVVDMYMSLPIGELLNAMEPIKEAPKNSNRPIVSAGK